MDIHWTQYGLAKVGFMGTDAMGSYTMMGILSIWRQGLRSSRKDYGAIF